MRKVIDGNRNTISMNIEGKYPFDMDLIAEQLQEYLWTNLQSDLDSLGHHYEFESIDNIQENDCTILPDNAYAVSLSFLSHVTIYLDNEDDSGMSYSFPTTVSKLHIEKQNGKWEADFNDLDISFNTDGFYQ